jgi:predicted Rossmann fold flavoprotein
VRIFLRCNIREAKRADQFSVCTESDEFRAPALVVATGGLSIPKMGATSFGYDLARQFGLKVRPTRPALVPFVFSAEDRQSYSDLSGVSAEVIATANGKRFRDKMLITHRGLSGPAILQISSYWRQGSPIGIDLAPDLDFVASLRDRRNRDGAARAALQTNLPKRFAARWLEVQRPSLASHEQLAAFDRKVHGWTLQPAGTEGYEKAEVTAGGVDTDELLGKTMESRKVPGLFFIGEVIDVTGHLGGHNFQWAWSSGVAAGRAL